MSKYNRVDGFFRIAAVGKTTRVDVFDAATGEYLCQLQRREVAGWLARSNRSRRMDEQFAGLDMHAKSMQKLLNRARRFDRVKAYLATRAARPVQLSLI